MERHGFSLLELSIVLVIIGLIAGGIVAGASMIRAAELRAVITEQEKNTISVNTFRDKYLALPGDMKNAAKFWGAQAGTTVDGTDATCIALDHTSPSTDGTTCNGNGDGEIGTNATTYERFRFWQQLANAELIEGSYTGVRGAGNSSHAVLSENVLASKLSGAGWTILHWDITGDSGNFDNNYSNHLLFGAAQATGSTASPVLAPEEAWNIDKKLDDGMPARGNVIASHYTTCTNATAGQSSNFDAEYLLSSSDILCPVRFKMSF